MSICRINAKSERKTTWYSNLRKPEGIGEEGR